MFIGPNLSNDPPYLDIGRLDAFTYGYEAASSRAVNQEANAFFGWLRDEASAFPGQGWARYLLELANGDHEAAIQRFFSYVHEYLLLRRPSWFIRFNQEPRPSMLVNGFGTPKSPDVRRADHVASAGGENARSGVDIRVSAFELGDGFELQLGLPDDVRTWWNGQGRRVVVVSRSRGRKPMPEEVLRAIDGRRDPLRESLDDIARACADAKIRGFDACVADAGPDRFIILVRGRCGAAWIRDGKLLAVAGETESEVLWTIEPGDRVLLLSPVLFELAQKTGPGPLPAQLATAEPIAWTQAVEGAARRLAVCIEWPAA